MSWVYISAVVAAVVASMHYVRTQRESLTQTRTWFGRVTVSFAGISAVSLFFTLVIAGTLVGPWWLPLIALVMGVAANTVVEESPLASLSAAWALVPLAAAAGLTAFLAYTRSPLAWLGI